jgi:hypothetical protein
VCGWLISGLIDEIDTLARQMQQAGDVSAESMADAAWEQYRDLFLLGATEISGGLINEIGVLKRDEALVQHKWVTFEQMTRAACAAISEADHAAAASIAAGRAPAAPVVPLYTPSWPAGQVYPIEESVAKRGLQMIIDQRQQVAGELVGLLGTGVATRLALAIEGFLSLGLLTVVAIESCCAQITAAINVATYAPAVVVGSKLTGTDDDLDEFRRSFNRRAATILDGAADVRSVIWQIQDTLANLPYLVQSFGVYLESSLFSDQEIESAYDALITVRSLTERSALAYGEVDFQLGEHDARLIEALADRSVDLRSDLLMMGRNITEMVA